jgi:peroxiredoxin
MNGRTTRVLALLAALTVVLSAAACAGPGARQTEAPSGDGKEAIAANPGDAEETSATKTPSDRGEAAGFAIKTLDGERFQLSEKRGEVVALFFMAGWCGSCIPEARAWSELQPAYEDEGLDVLVVSVDPNDTKETIEGFKRAGGIEQLPWAIDETGEFTRSLGVRALDTTIIINREGKIAYRDDVPTPYETLDKELKEVL